MTVARRIAAACCACVLAAVALPAAAQVTVIATNPPGSSYYAASAAISKIAQESTGKQFRIQPTGGSNIYLPMVNRREVEYVFASVQDIEFAVKGIENFEGKATPDVRLVGVVFPLVVGLGVAGNSPAKTVAQLKGMRAPAGYPAQFVTLYNQDAMLATGGMTTAQMAPVMVPNQIKGVEALAEGRADIAVVGPFMGIAHETHAKLASQGGLRFLPLDSSEAGRAAMKKVIRRAYFATVMPDKSLPFITGPTTVMHLSVFMCTHKDMPDADVYEMVKLLHGKKKAMADATPALAQFDPDFMAEEITVAYHPGAIKFYQEIGQWPARER